MRISCSYGATLSLSLSHAYSFSLVICAYPAGGQLGSYPLGNVLIFTVSGAYVLSGLLFVFAALADDKNISAEWEKKKII